MASAPAKLLGGAIGIWIALAVAVCLLAWVQPADAAHPCSYCEYCSFCPLCDNECPCDHAKECEYCQYCHLCTLCSLCDSACSEDSLVTSALSWFGDWQDTALSMMGVSEADLPDWDKLEEVVEEAKEVVPKARVSLTDSKRKEMKDLAARLAKLSFEEFHGIVSAVHHKHPEWWARADEEAKRRVEDEL